jgi:hypothetical protein
MFLYLKDPKHFTKKLLDLINTSSNAVGYKLTYKFLYTNNEQVEKKIRKTILLTIASKKYLSINLTKEVKDLYNETSKPLKREIKENATR